MLLEIKNGFVELFDNASCIDRMHNWLIKFLVGKKPVMLNVNVSYQYEYVCEVKDCSRLLLENVTMVPNLKISGVKNY